MPGLKNKINSEDFRDQLREQARTKEDLVAEKKKLVADHQRRLALLQGLKDGLAEKKKALGYLIQERYFLKEKIYETKQIEILEAELVKIKPKEEPKEGAPPPAGTPPPATKK